MTGRTTGRGRRAGRLAAALALALGIGAGAAERAEAACAYCAVAERLAAALRCVICTGEAARCETCERAAKALREVAGCASCAEGCADKARCAVLLPAAECRECALVYAVVRNLSCSVACREATLMADPGATEGGADPKLAEAMGGLERGKACEGCREVRFHVLYSGALRCGVARLMEEGLDLDPGAAPGEDAVPAEPGK